MSKVSFANWGPAEQKNADVLVDLALSEDLGDDGDITSAAFFIPKDIGEVNFVARKAGILAGWPVVETVISEFPDLQLRSLRKDSDALKKGDIIGTVSGPVSQMLTAERTALNFLQRLSGVATLTRSYVDIVAGTNAKILDTRKTTPGWRYLEKYAVRCGGGENHRIGLFDTILIKDNHIAALNLPHPQNVTTAIQKARQGPFGMRPLIVEVDDLIGFEAALHLNPDVILLDNMSVEDMRHAVRIRDRSQSKTQLEASGGITHTTLRSVAETGIDRISIGALTHSAPALDIALDFVN